MLADDATFAMDGSIKTFQKFMHILDQYKQISGLKLNINKTIILLIDSLRSSNIKYLRQLKFIWSSESAKAQGRNSLL